MTRKSVRRKYLCEVLVSRDDISSDFFKFMLSSTRNHISDFRSSLAMEILRSIASQPDESYLESDYLDVFEVTTNNRRV